MNYLNKKVLVTGAAGFIGRHLLDALDRNCAEYAVVSRCQFACPQAKASYVGDIRDQNFLSSVMSIWRPEIIFHLAATKERTLTLEAFERSIDTNLIGTLRLLFQAANIGTVHKIVMLGTGEEYGGNLSPFREDMREQPVSAYSQSKQSATQLAQLMARNMGLPVCILRPSVAYGPGQQDDMFLPALIRALLQGKSFPMTGGEQTRDYIYVEDLVEAIVAAGVCSDSSGEIVNIGSGRGERISDVVDLVEQMMGVNGLVKRGALAYRIGEPMDYCLDISKAARLLNWRPKISLVEGLRRTIDWYINSAKT